MSTVTAEAPMLNRTPAEEIMEIVRELPGLTASQIGEMATHLPMGSIWNRLNVMETRGEIISTLVPSGNSSGKAMVKAYSLNPDPANRPPVRPYRRKIPTIRGEEEQVSVLRAQIAELEDWKADAIKRYPDLAVPEVVMRARKIVADIYRDSGDPHGAADALAGKRDHTPIIKATVAALENG